MGFFSGEENIIYGTLKSLLPSLKGWLRGKSRARNSISSSAQQQFKLIFWSKLSSPVLRVGCGLWNMEKRERANSQLRDGRGRECVNLREWILQQQKHRCRGWWAIMTGWGGCLIPGALERLHAAAGTLISAAFALQWRQRVSRGISPLYSRRHTGGERPIKLRNEQHIQRHEWRASSLPRRTFIWCSRF